MHPQNKLSDEANCVPVKAAGGFLSSTSQIFKREKSGSHQTWEGDSCNHAVGDVLPMTGIGIGVDTVS